MSITQTEYDYLIELQKVFDEQDSLVLAIPPTYSSSTIHSIKPVQWTRFLTAPETKDKFQLDFYRSGFEITKYTYNNRHHQTIILVRYDSMGRHTNPDGVSFNGPHVHLYREGFNDKFAFPVSTIGIDENDAINIVLEKFLDYCNVSSRPQIEPPLY